MSVRSVKFWRDVYPLVLRFCREAKLPFNRVVNLAVVRLIRGEDCSIEVLKLEARKVELFREEADLRKTWTAIARSGAYLPNYAARVLKPQEAKSLAIIEHAQHSGFHFDRRVEDLPRTGQVPLKALSRREEALFKRICARREAIAKELCMIEAKLLPKTKFHFKSQSQERSSDRSPSTEVNECH